MTSLASDLLPSSIFQHLRFASFLPLYRSSPPPHVCFPIVAPLSHLCYVFLICLYVHLFFYSLLGPLTVSVEDPPPAPPPVSIPSFPSSSSSVFSPHSSDRWTPERSRPRGSAPNRNARIPPRTDLPLDTQPPFVWRRGQLTECSASCGKGLILMSLVDLHIYSIFKLIALYTILYLLTLDDVTPPSSGW